ncbi:cytochrome P450 [Nemania sp. FL0031]|nr:cytochrome P450 [Nemania sp. FL0031]
MYSRVGRWSADALSNMSPEHMYELRGLFLFLVSLTLWRLWRFTVSPFLNPQQPRELPYWIPYIGHGIGFFRDANSALKRATSYFGGSRDPFALTVFGSNIYIISQPGHTNEVYRETESLSFEIFVQILMQSNGMSTSGLKAAYSPLPRDKTGFPNPHGEALGVFVRQMNIHQLYPGDNLDNLDVRVVKWFDEHLHIPEIRRTSHTFLTSEKNEEICVPLMRWCSESMVQAAGAAYFGDCLAAIDSDLASSFLTFDDLGWQVLYQYPAFLTKRLASARHRVQETLKTYFSIPQGKRSDAVWLIKAVEDEFRAAGGGDDDVAVLFFNIYWGINTNTRKVAFWMMAYLLDNPTLFDVIRNETAPSFQHDTLIDPSYLWKECPNLDAIWCETLRHCSNAASVRLVTKDTCIGGKVMRQGSRVMIPYRLLHFDEAIYGDDIESFRPDRFIKKGFTLTRGSSWRPFGGGKTMCTGRYAAKHAIFIFMAMLLRRFDVTTVGQFKVPEADLGRPVLGIVSTKGDEDMVIKLTQRSLKSN